MLQLRPPLVPHRWHLGPSSKGAGAARSPCCPAMWRAQPMLSRWRVATGHTDIRDRARLLCSLSPTLQAASASHLQQQATQPRTPKLVFEL